MTTKTLLCTVLCILPAVVCAQPDFESLQQQWLQDVKTGEEAQAYYWEDKYQLYGDVTVT